MILPFKSEFQQSILNGTKIHTIREDKNRRWRAGAKIHFATGVRTKKYNQFKEGICTGCQHVFMTYAFNDVIQISIDGRELFGFNERLEFAKNDGFNSWEEFFDWFYPIIQAHPDKHFSGRVIHWTDFRYKDDTIK